MESGELGRPNRRVHRNGQDSIAQRDGKGVGSYLSSRDASPVLPDPEEGRIQLLLPICDDCRE